MESQEATEPRRTLLQRILGKPEAQQDTAPPTEDAVARLEVRVDELTRQAEASSLAVDQAAGVIKNLTDRISAMEALNVKVFGTASPDEDYLKDFLSAEVAHGVELAAEAQGIPQSKIPENSPQQADTAEEIADKLQATSSPEERFTLGLKLRDARRKQN